MSVRPINANQAHTKLIRLEDEMQHLIARLNASGFEQAAQELGYIVDECLAPVHEAIGLLGEEDNQ